MRKPYPPSFGRGERNSRARLTEDDVLSIRRRYSEGGGSNNGGISQRELGEEYGVGKANVGRITRRTSWKHI